MMKESHRFWEAWQFHCHSLLKKSLKRTGGNVADAEDVLSTAMLRALEAFPRRAHELSNVEAWLTRILHNTCVDLHRERRRSAPAPSVEQEDGQDLTNPAAPTPEQTLLRREDLLALRRQLTALPEPLRQPCSMRFEQGMTYEDIARALGLTLVNVRGRILRSCRHLRSAFGRGGMGLAK